MRGLCARTGVWFVLGGHEGMPRALRTEGFLRLTWTSVLVRRSWIWHRGYSQLPNWCEQRQTTVKGALVLFRNKQMAVSKREARNKPAGVGVGDPRTTALEWESDCP